MTLSMKNRASNKPDADNPAVERMPSNQPSGPETPHKGAEKQSSAQTPVPETVSTPTRREATGKQKDAAANNRRATEKATAEKKAHSKARRGFIQQTNQTATLISTVTRDEIISFLEIATGKRSIVNLRKRKRGQWPLSTKQKRPTPF